MDHTPERFAYRCLPLVIANSHGWELLLDQSFVATWSGGASAEELQISFPDENRSLLPASHFGQGVLTLQVGYLFETEEHYNLWIMGPVNRPKDGITPVCGVIETDWLPYTFTMNWLFTRPGTVRFEKGEPFCHVFPIPRQLLSTIDPEIRDLEQVPEKSNTYASWRASRGATVDRMRKGQMEPTEKLWSMNYFRGQTPDGGFLVEDHETRLTVKPFADRTSGRVTR